MARVGDRSAGVDHREKKQWSCHYAIPSAPESPWTCEGWEVQHSWRTIKGWKSLASWRGMFCHFGKKQLWHNVFQPITRRRLSDSIALSWIAVKNTVTHSISLPTWMKLHSLLTCHQTVPSITQARKPSKSAPQEMRKIELQLYWRAAGMVQK